MDCPRSSLSMFLSLELKRVAMDHHHSLQAKTWRAAKSAGKPDGYVASLPLIACLHTCGAILDQPMQDNASLHPYQLLMVHAPSLLLVQHHCRSQQPLKSA